MILLWRLRIAEHPGTFGGTTINMRRFQMNGNILDVRVRRALTTAALACVTVIAGCRATNPDTAGPVQPGAPVAVQPGAPGEPTRILSQDEVTAVGLPEYTQADVEFMKGMISHHAQALDMTVLIADRSNDRQLALLGERITVSQKSEIGLMQDWLRRREQAVPEVGGHHHHMMPGMLTQQQMDTLAAASGGTFYKLFLEYMIQHHEGALTMVADLFGQDGAAQDTEVFRFASDVDVDQRMEITRMRQMLARFN